MAAQPDNVNARIVATVGICGTIITWGIILWLQGIYGHDQQNEDFRKSSMLQRQAYSELIAQQNAALAEYKKNGDNLAVPIDRAMELVVRDIKANPGAATPPMPPGAVPGGTSAAPGTGAGAATPDAATGTSPETGAPIGGSSGAAPSAPPGVKAVGGLGNAEEAASDRRGRGTEREPQADPKTVDEGKDRTKDSNEPKGNQ